MKLGRNLKTILQAIEPIVEKTRSQTKETLFKLRQMQEIYLKRSSERYSNSHINRIKRHFASVEFKFLLTCIHLEQLWALSEDARFDLVDAVANSLERLDWTANQSIIGSLFLESFLFEARSFLDVYMFYICLIMGIDNPGTMKVTKFKQHMKSRKETSFEKRATQLLKYFEQQVFGKDHWGELLRSLRDKISHRERLSPSRNGSETLLGKVLLDWPTLRRKTFDRFCQDINNGMFEMLCETSPMLFELEWKSGPYKPDLWGVTS